MTQFLPEALRPSIRGLTDEQLKIYEDFGSNPKKITQNNNPLYNNNQNFANNQINNRNLATSKKENEENVDNFFNLKLYFLISLRNMIRK
jgi:hypothetical protein